MRRFATVAALIALAAYATPAAAQKTFGFGAHAGVSMPMGDYGDDSGTDSGYADLGFSGGLDLWYPLTQSGALSWYTSADAVAHGLGDNSPFEDDGGYLFIPLMTGLRFDAPVGPVSAFLTGQAGAILAKGPGDGANLGTNFGFNVGGGLQLGPNFYAGLKYYPLGDTEFDYDVTEGAVDTSVSVERNVSFLDIYLGFGVH